MTDGSAPTGPPDPLPLEAYEPSGARRSEIRPARSMDLSGDLIDWVALDGVAPSPPEFYVEEQIPKGEVIMLSGHGGLGKTTLAIQLQVAGALGVPWLGWAVNEPLRSLALYCEDKPQVLHWRMHHAANHYGAAFREIGGLVNTLCGKGADNRLWGPDGGPTEFYDRFSDLAHQTQPQIIIFDPVADLFGGEENDRYDVTRFIRTALEPLALDLNAAVIFLAHPSKSGMFTGDGTSGSTQWHNAVRSRLYLYREKADAKNDDEGVDRPLILENMKANYATSGNKRQLRFQDGVFVVDGLDAACLNMVDRIDRDNREKLVDDIFLEGVREIETQGRYVHHAKSSPYFAPREIANLSSVRASGIGQSELLKSMRRLLDQHRIAVGEGRRKNRSQREQIVIVGDTT